MLREEGTLGIRGNVLLPLLCSLTVRWKQNDIDRGGEKVAANDVKTHSSLRGEMRSRRREVVVVVVVWANGPQFTSILHMRAAFC